MLRDITIGQYYEEDSVIHKMDPRFKLAATLIYIISLFTFQSFIGYAMVTLFLAVVIQLSKVPLRYILKGMKPILMILMITVIFNVFLGTGEQVIFQWKFIKVTWEGVRNAVFLGMRLVYLIIGSSLMTFTTTPNQLTDGLEHSLAPLNKIKVPVHEISMMMSIALRFIPILMEELDKIMKAQQARGADFENGNILKRLKSLVPVLIPLFVSAFRRAEELAFAMEARCYTGGEGRTKMKPLKYHKRDIIGYLVSLFYLCAVIAIGRITS